MRWEVPLAAALLLAVAVPAAAQVGQVDDPTGTACLNPTGKARCSGVSVSPTDEATNDVACITEIGCVAVSGTGPAHNGPLWCGADVGCVAVSGTGPATNAGFEGYAECQSAVGCLAVSATNDARNAGLDCRTGFGCVAASGTGNASTAGSGTCKAVYVGCVAASGTGDASNPEDCSAQIGCVTVSGTGQAQGGTAVSGCQAVEERTGSSLVCLESDERHAAGSPADGFDHGGFGLEALLEASLPG